MLGLCCILIIFYLKLFKSMDSAIDLIGKGDKNMWVQLYLPKRFYKIPVG